MPTTTEAPAGAYAARSAISIQSSASPIPTRLPSQVGAVIARAVTDGAG